MTYVPDGGDIVWITLDHQAGHEQAGRRPAMVLSPRACNGKVGLALCCLITSQAKGYPFEVAVAADHPVTGVILSDQVRSLDWRARCAKRADALDDETVAAVLQKPLLLLL